MDVLKLNKEERAKVSRDLIAYDLGRDMGLQIVDRRRRFTDSSDRLEAWAQGLRDYLAECKVSL